MSLVLQTTWKISFVIFINRAISELIKDFCMYILVITPKNLCASHLPQWELRQNAGSL